MRYMVTMEVECKTYRDQINVLGNVFGIAQGFFVADMGREVVVNTSTYEDVPVPELPADDGQETLEKVYAVLRKNGFDDQMVGFLVSEIQNHGIIFRERAK